MGLRNVIDRLAEHAGLGEEEVNSLLAEGALENVDLSQPIPGEAAEAFEVFLPDAVVDADEMAAASQTKDGLMWAPMIRAGQWAVRPGPKGQKVRRKLKVVEGNSTDPRKELGLADLKAAFDDEAVENVTVPTSHDNKTLENTGFIRKTRISDMKIHKGPKKGETVKALFGGYDFTEPDIKGKVTRGTIAGRSCGILYDYTNTETGKTYPAVVEHVALTQKPWITGMVPFGRSLTMANDLEVVPLQLSDEEPEAEFDPESGDEVEAELDSSETNGSSDAAVTWTHEDSPNWMRQQVDEILRAARIDKQKTRRQSQSSLYVEDTLPYYRCVEAKPSKALISDGYGDGANHWVAGFTIDDGTVELDDFDQWTAVKSVMVKDDRDPPATDKEPLEEVRVVRKKLSEMTAQERLADAQGLRRDRTSGAEPAERTKQPPRGGEQHMAGENGGESTLQLSEEARAAIQAAEDKAAATEERNLRLSEQVARLSGSVQEKDADEYLDKLKKMGFDEEHGFGGLLTSLREVLLADDGEPAVVSESFSEDGKTEVGLSLTSAFRRVFDTIEVGEDGKAKLGEQLAEPSETGGTEGEGKEVEKAGAKPTEDGKPAAEEGDQTLSEEEREAKAKEKADDLAEDPAYAAVIGPPQSKQDDSKNGGEA